MLLDERIGPLEKGDDVLQCMIASLTIRVAGIEARYRPSSGIGVIDDWDDNDPNACSQSAKVWSSATINR